MMTFDSFVYGNLQVGIVVVSFTTRTGFEIRKHYVFKVTRSDFRLFAGSLPHLTIYSESTVGK